MLPMFTDVIFARSIMSQRQSKAQGNYSELANSARPAITVGAEFASCPTLSYLILHWSSEGLGMIIEDQALCQAPNVGQGGWHGSW